MPRLLWELIRALLPTQGGFVASSAPRRVAFKLRGEAEVCRGGVVPAREGVRGTGRGKEWWIPSWKELVVTEGGA